MKMTLLPVMDLACIHDLMTTEYMIKQKDALIHERGHEECGELGSCCIAHKSHK